MPAIVAKNLRTLTLSVFFTAIIHNHNSYVFEERNEEIFLWWRKNKERFPKIAEGAKILLNIPATSVCSERTFSMVGLLYANSLRNRFLNY